MVFEDVGLLYAGRSGRYTVFAAYMRAGLTVGARSFLICCVNRSGMGNGVAVRWNDAACRMGRTQPPKAVKRRTHPRFHRVSWSVV